MSASQAEGGAPKQTKSKYRLRTTLCCWLIGYDRDLTCVSTVSSRKFTANENTMAITSNRVRNIPTTHVIPQNSGLNQFSCTRLNTLFFHIFYNINIDHHSRKSFRWTTNYHKCVLVINFKKVMTNLFILIDFYFYLNSVNWTKKKKLFTCTLIWEYTLKSTGFF